ncbi:peptidoglycan editing factor PgeF [Dyella caseinilytica]|uniref:Purine nucleoside phosphorylase n=1 Tax=Dyella caseinilytica TaxID=1849581 RepID=A0ABX7GXA2_9GAMM|nr:peptidoglycan editing factor PgeF [Dyella caseinilytica]QRN54342.1 peptidoglycan editing factor PgeF [Dyella caseinilytica]
MSDAWIFPDWPAPASVHAAVTTRDGPGVSQPPFGRFNLGLRSGEDAQIVCSNRGALRQSLGLPAEPRWLRQVHGTTVADLGPLPSPEEPEADAAVSHLSGTVLAILTADCVPVLFCTQDGGTIGAAHAGWKGLAAGILEETIEQMQQSAASVMAWIGPCIAKPSYEVGEEVRKAFLAHDAAFESAFEATRPGHWLCDLAMLARLRLQAAGVRRIYGGQFDTRADTRFYSYRREGARSGRFASLIWLGE